MEKTPKKRVVKAWTIISPGKPPIGGNIVGTIDNERKHTEPKCLGECECDERYMRYFIFADRRGAVKESGGNKVVPCEITLPNTLKKKI